MSEIYYETFWNGEPCKAKRLRVIVGPSPATWWCAELEGAERDAVEVIYGKQTFYLDNEDGSGWLKVTKGRGSPMYGHKSLPFRSLAPAASSPSRYPTGDTQ